ncbi:MAG: 2-oxoacid:acceptor oxidoreductase family protein [Sulfolobales archaeon]
MRWHGRGGQGVWSISNILAEAAIREGKYAQSFPTFGPERMGAPVAAFTRISEDEISIHSGIYQPDAVVVLDSSLIGSENFVHGLKPGGVLLLNYPSDINIKELSNLIRNDLSAYKVYVLPATELALKLLGRPITNTSMLGALLKVLPVVRFDAVEEVIRGRFKGPVAEKNIEVLRKSYESVVYVRD